MRVGMSFRTNDGEIRVGGNESQNKRYCHFIRVQISEPSWYSRSMTILFQKNNRDGCCRISIFWTRDGGLCCWLPWVSEAAATCTKCPAWLLDRTCTRRGTSQGRDLGSCYEGYRQGYHAWGTYLASLQQRLLPSSRSVSRAQHYCLDSWSEDMLLSNQGVCLSECGVWSINPSFHGQQLFSFTRKPYLWLLLSLVLGYQRNLIWSKNFNMNKEFKCQ